jgi:hypothetical protein
VLNVHKQGTTIGRFGQASDLCAGWGYQEAAQFGITQCGTHESVLGASLDPKTSRQIMRLILELCQERGLAAIVNIHDVVLATEFLPRIVGLRAGSVVFDGPAAQVDREVLTRIYGDEDWTAITQRMQATADATQDRAENNLALTAA